MGSFKLNKHTNKNWQLLNVIVFDIATKLINFRYILHPENPAHAHCEDKLDQKGPLFVGRTVPVGLALNFVDDTSALRWPETNWAHDSPVTTSPSFGSVSTVFSSLSVSNKQPARETSDEVISLRRLIHLRRPIKYNIKDCLTPCHTRTFYIRHLHASYSKKRK